MEREKGNRKNNVIWKRKRIAAVLLALTLGLCAAAPTMRTEASQAAGYSLEQTGLSSRGSLVYREADKGAHIYAADFLLLQDRLDTIPDTVFEPGCYTHTHRWEYLDINGQTHRRHCGACGTAFDLVRAHRAERRESCSLIHDGAEYPGIRYTCVCGYQWELEEAHTLFFEAVDENGHRSGCRLGGTGFCPGYEPLTEEHYAYSYEPCEDGMHHEKICMDCGYRSEEACCFNLSDTDDDGENGSGEGVGEADGGDSGSGGRCWCGNVEKPDAGTEEENTGAETGDERPDPETGSENTEEEGKNESPGEGMETENPDKESGDENPDAGKESENADENPGDQETPTDENEAENENVEQGGGYEE